MTESTIDDTATNGTRHGGHGNRNALRTGRYALVGGKLPEDAKYIENDVNAFRRSLEGIVTENRGAISLPDACAIQTAMKWERHSCLALYWLRKNEAALSPMDKLAFSREMARGSSERDKAIAMLKLDNDQKFSLPAFLYGNARVLPAATKPAEQPAADLAPIGARLEPATVDAPIGATTEGDADAQA